MCFNKKTKFMLMLYQISSENKSEIKRLNINKDISIRIT